MLLALIAAQKAAPYQCICHPSTSYPAAIYHLEVRVSISDVMFDHASSPSAMLITIKASKTDPFRKGTTLALSSVYCALLQQWQCAYEEEGLALVHPSDLKMVNH